MLTTARSLFAITAALVLVPMPRAQVSVDYPPLLPTLEQTLRFVDAVAYVEFGDYALTTFDRRVVYRQYTCQLIDLLAASERTPELQTSFKLNVPGGILVIDGKEIHTDNPFPPFNKGDRRILFLRRGGDNGYGIAFGSSGTFLVTGADVEMPNDVRRLREIDGADRLPYQAFRGLLRRSIGKS